MSKSRKKIKQSKAREKERLAAKRAEEAAGGKPKIAGDRERDSFGESIPKESERKSEHRAARERLLRERQLEQQFRRNNSLSKKVKTKTKYVLSKEARKTLITWIAIGVAVIAVIVAVIAVLNAQEAKDKVKEDSGTVAAAVIGITSEGRELIESTHKFDTFLLNEDGIPYADIYDSNISVADARALEAYGQYPDEEGIVPYNKERSLTKRNPEDIKKIARDEGTSSPALQ